VDLPSSNFCRVWGCTDAFIGVFGFIHTKEKLYAMSNWNFSWLALPVQREKQLYNLWLRIALPHASVMRKFSHNSCCIHPFAHQLIYLLRWSVILEKLTVPQFLCSTSPLACVSNCSTETANSQQIFCASLYYLMRLERQVSVYIRPSSGFASIIDIRTVLIREEKAFTFTAS
jgi:hypothetical protein